MSTLQVRDIPEAIYQKLKYAAELDHRSIAQETVKILEKGLEMTRNPKDRRKKIIQTIFNHASAKDKHQLSDPVKLLRKDRNR